MLLKLTELTPLLFLPDFEKAAKASERATDNITKEDSCRGGGEVCASILHSIRFSLFFFQGIPQGKN